MSPPLSGGGGETPSLGLGKKTGAAVGLGLGGAEGCSPASGRTSRADQTTEEAVRAATPVPALAESITRAQLPTPPLPALALEGAGRPSSPSLSELQPLTSVISSSESLSLPPSTASGPPALGSARRGAAARPEGRSGPRPSAAAASRGAALGLPPAPAAGRWPREPARGLG